MEVVRVPDGPGGYIREHMRQAVERAEMPTLPRHFVTMEDLQVNLLLVSMSLARHTPYLEREVIPDLGKKTWRQADALPLWVVERQIEMPGFADFDAFADDDVCTELLTLSPNSQKQVHMSH